MSERYGAEAGAPSLLTEMASARQPKLTDSAIGNAFAGATAKVPLMTYPAAFVSTASITSADITSLIISFTTKAPFCPSVIITVSTLLSRIRWAAFCAEAISGMGMPKSNPALVSFGVEIRGNKERGSLQADTVFKMVEAPLAEATEAEPQISELGH